MALFVGWGSGSSAVYCSRRHLAHLKCDIFKGFVSSLGGKGRQALLRGWGDVAMPPGTPLQWPWSGHKKENCALHLADRE